MLKTPIFGKIWYNMPKILENRLIEEFKDKRGFYTGRTLSILSVLGARTKRRNFRVEDL